MQPQAPQMQPQGGIPAGWGAPKPPAQPTGMPAPPIGSQGGQQPPERSAFDLSRDSIGMQPGSNPAAQPWTMPQPAQPASKPPSNDFFNQGPMRFPTMSGLNV